MGLLRDIEDAGEVRGDDYNMRAGCIRMCNSLASQHEKWDDLIHQARENRGESRVTMSQE